MSETGQSIDYLYRLVDRFLPFLGEARTEALRVIDQLTRRITDGNDDKRKLQQQIDTLTAERNEARDGYHQLDSNWATLHEAAMGPIRSALDLPDGSVLEIVTAIEALKQVHTHPPVDPRPLHVFWDEDSTYVVAHDSDDAERVYAEHVGDDDVTGTLSFSRFPDERDIRIKMYYRGPHVDQIAPADEESDDIETVTKIARAWADLQGRGFLCTSDF